MRKIIVPSKYDGKKLNTFIFDVFPMLSTSELYKALRKKDIRVNDKKTSENIVIHTDDTVVLYIIDDKLFGQIDIVYEDDNIIVVNKPEALPVTEDYSSPFTLSSILKERYGNDINPCHRIDRNTKGLVLFAKNSIALDILLEKFKNREIEKHYYAVVYGIPKVNHQIIKSYLFKDSKKNMVYISDTPKAGYKEIITEYTIISSDKTNHTSNLDVILHTGRTHQIRAHLAHIGYPIIGDGKYGTNKINKQFSKKRQELYNYKLIFNFKTDSGILEYLKDKEISLKKP